MYFVTQIFMDQTPHPQLSRVASVHAVKDGGGQEPQILEKISGLWILTSDKEWVKEKHESTGNEPQTLG